MESPPEVIQLNWFIEKSESTFRKTVFLRVFSTFSTRFSHFFDSIFQGDDARLWKESTIGLSRFKLTKRIKFVNEFHKLQKARKVGYSTNIY